jgi:nucleoside-diphosphate-sugar epimerase
VGEYAESCLAREEAFTAAARDHGTRVVLVRLNYSVELRYGVLVDIAQKVAREQPVDVTMGYLNAIWQRDAIAHVIHAAELATSTATPINITGAETLSVRDLARRFGARMGRPVTIIGTEAETALLSNASESHRRFGPPRTSLDQMITWIAAWVQQGGATWGKPTGFEVRDGRY